MLKIWLVFQKSDPHYACKCYAYKENMYFDADFFEKLTIFEPRIEKHYYYEKFNAQYK